MSKHIGGDWWEMTAPGHDRCYYANSATSEVSWEYPPELLAVTASNQVSTTSSSIINTTTIHEAVHVVVEEDKQESTIAVVTDPVVVPQIESEVKPVVVDASPSSSINQSTMMMDNSVGKEGEGNVVVDNVVVKSAVDVPKEVSVIQPQLEIQPHLQVEPHLVSPSLQQHDDDDVKPVGVVPKEVPIIHQQAVDYTLIKPMDTATIMTSQEPITSSTSQPIIPPTASQWEIRKDTASGRIFYYDKSTHKSTFFKPEGFVDDSGRLNQANKNPYKWRRNVDAESGRIYYYNIETRVTRWKVPLCVVKAGGKYGIAYIPNADDDDDEDVEDDDEEKDEEKFDADNNSLAESTTPNPLMSGLEATSPRSNPSLSFLASMNSGAIMSDNSNDDDNGTNNKKKKMMNICNVYWSKLHKSLLDFVPEVNLANSALANSISVGNDDDDEKDDDDDDDKGRTAESLKSREAIRHYVPVGIKYSGIVLEKGRRLQRRRAGRESVTSSNGTAKPAEEKPKHLRSKSMRRVPPPSDIAAVVLNPADLWDTILSNLSSEDVPKLQNLESSLDTLIDIANTGRMSARGDEAGEIRVEINYEDFVGKFFNMHRRSRGIFSSQKQLTTVDRVINWKAETISTSLFPLSAALSEKAVHAFEMLNECCTKSDSETSSSSRNKNSAIAGMTDPVWDLPTVSVQRVCDLMSLVMCFDDDYDPDTLLQSQQAQELHDEFFCQLCKQTNGNPNDRDCVRCWLLMLISLTCFLPSVLLRPYLANYFAFSLSNESAKPQKNHVVRACLEYLLRSSWIEESYRQLFPLASVSTEEATRPAMIIRRSIPSRMEVTSIVSQKSSSVRLWMKLGISANSETTCSVSFNDSEPKDVVCAKKRYYWQYIFVDKVTTWTTSEQLVELAAVKLGVTNIVLAKQMFGIYLSSRDETSHTRYCRPVAPTTRILDLLSRIDKELNGPVSTTSAVQLTASSKKKTAPVAKKGGDASDSDDENVRRPNKKSQMGDDDNEEDNRAGADNDGPAEAEDDEYDDGQPHLMICPRIWLPCDFSDPVLSNLIFLFTQEYVISGNIPCCERDAIILASLQFHSFVDEYLDKSSKANSDQFESKDADHNDDGEYEALSSSRSDGDYGASEQVARRKLKESLKSYFNKSFLKSKKKKVIDDDEAVEGGETNHTLLLLEDCIIQLEYEVFHGNNVRMKDRMTSADAKKLFVEYCFSWKVFGASYFLVQACNTIDYPEYLIIAINFRAIFLIDIDSKIFLAEIPWKSVVTWGSSSEGFVVVVGTCARPDHANPISLLTNDGKAIQDVMSSYADALFPVKSAPGPMLAPGSSQGTQSAAQSKDLATISEEKI